MCMKQAIGDKNNAGNLKLHTNMESNSAESASAGTCRAAHLVHKTTLSTLLRAVPPGVIGFMKLDCEGCEPSALMG